MPSPSLLKPSLGINLLLVCLRIDAAALAVLAEHAQAVPYEHDEDEPAEEAQLLEHGAAHDALTRRTKRCSQSIAGA